MTFDECIAKIEEWRTMRGGLPLFNDVDTTVDDAPWGEPSWWEDQSCDVTALAQEIGAHLPSAADSEVVRCFVLACTWQQRNWHWCDWADDAKRRRVETINVLGRSILDEWPATRIQDLPQFEWEVIAAAEFGHWNRLDELHFAWKRLGPEHAIAAERTIARVKAVSAMIRADSIIPELWLEYRHGNPETSPFAKVTVGYCAISVGGASSHRLQWKQSAELDDAVVQRLYEASDGFRRAEDRSATLTAVERALAGWCDAAIGIRTQSSERLRRSCLAYSGIESGIDGPPEVVHKARLLTLARLSCWVQDFQQASMHAESLVSNAPEDPWAWELLAQIRRRLGDEHGWVDAYNRFIDLSPQFSEDWERNELLLLGLRHRESVRLMEMVAAAPALKSELDVTEAVLVLDWPQFGAFCAEARERWLFAVTQLSNPRIATASGELRWAAAAEASGEAVASQLRSLLAGPLREWLVEKKLLTMLGRIRGPEAELARGLRSNRLSLGSVIELLEAAKNRSGELGPVIRGWLDEHRKQILFVLDRAWIERLRSMNEVRIPSAHQLMSSIDREAALRTYRTAKDCLADLGRAQGETP